MIRCLLPWLVLAALALPLPAGSQEPDPGAMRLAEADELFAAKRYPEAVLRYRECLDASPDRPTALFNGGLAAYMAGRHDLAVEWWERLRARESKDLVLLTKLVQAYEALGDRANRDARRAALLELRAELPPEERARRVRFCRDQFRVGERRLMVFEYFELEGDRPLRFRFSVLDEKDAEAWNVSLGSYESTTAIAREAGEIGPTERLFHLDGNFPGEHRTYGFYKSEPTYDLVKARVIETIRDLDAAPAGEKK